MTPSDTEVSLTDVWLILWMLHYCKTWKRVSVCYSHCMLMALQMMYKIIFRKAKLRCTLKHTHTHTHLITIWGSMRKRMTNEWCVLWMQPVLFCICLIVCHYMHIHVLLSLCTHGNERMKRFKTWRKRHLDDQWSIRRREASGVGGSSPSGCGFMYLLYCSTELRMWSH